MKKVLLTLGLVLSTQVYAAGALYYKCTGIDIAAQKTLKFDLSFDMYVNSNDFQGYSNQAVKITELDGAKVDNGTVFQLVSHKQIEGSLNSYGEVNLFAESLSMKPIKNANPSNDMDTEDVALTSSTINLTGQKGSMNIKAFCTQYFDNN